MDCANVCVQFRQGDLSRLDSLASELGLTRSEFLRRLVRDVRVIPAQFIFDGKVEVGEPTGAAELVPLGQ